MIPLFKESKSILKSARLLEPFIFSMELPKTLNTNSSAICNLFITVYHTQNKQHIYLDHGSLRTERGYTRKEMITKK